MVFLAVLVGSLLMLTAEAKVGNASDAEFCFETEQCLLFDVICETDDYEVRHYDSVKWVSTNERSFMMEMAAMRAFRRLYGYITGDNEHGKKIDMTTPVVVKMVDKKFWQRGTYTMSFLLPAEHQKNPPKPTNSEVFIHETPDVNVYVRSYGGWMTALEDDRQTRNLYGALDEVGAKYQKGYHFAVGYNSPMTMFNRHNEVWVVVEGDPVCPAFEEP
ncbi:heme-binding protein 2-like [Salarias fasciatus]|uniref:heme-binding protein 2-like n=1 Tax=Salarias fasciatus TaxID=181472 RepID=UPI001176FEE2|nr:heme-binding protein 2-like [Salarias fasciatus]